MKTHLLAGTVIATLIGFAVAQPPPLTAQPPSQPAAVIKTEPSETEADSLLFMYRAPVASSGMVNVYMGAGGKFYRTTPFRLTRYDLSTNGKRITVQLDVKPTSADKSQLEQQLAQGGVKASPSTPPSITIEQLVPMAPHAVRVKLFDPTGKLELGEATQENTSARFGRAPLSLDTEQGMVFGLSLKSAVTADELASLQLRIESDYTVKTGKIQTATFESLAANGLSVLEKALGTKIQPGDLIARDVDQRVVQAVDSGKVVKLFNADKDDAQLILGQFATALTRPVQISDFAALGDRYTIHTASLGALEVRPTAHTFVENERALKVASQSAFRERLKSLSEHARNSGDFASWMRAFTSKEERKGASSSKSDTSFGLEVFDKFGLDFGHKGGASGSFETILFKAAVDTGAMAKVRQVYDLLLSDKEIDVRSDQAFEQWFKGSNTIVDHYNKAFRLAVVRDMADVTREMAKIERVNTYTTTTIPFTITTVLGKTRSGEYMTALERRVKELEEKLTTVQAETATQVMNLEKRHTDFEKIASEHIKSATERFLVLDLLAVNGKAQQNALRVRLKSGGTAVFHDDGISYYSEGGDKIGEIRMQK